MKQEAETISLIEAQSRAEQRQYLRRGSVTTARCVVCSGAVYGTSAYIGADHSRSIVKKCLRCGTLQLRPAERFVSPANRDLHN